MREQPRAAARDIEAELGWRPLSEVPERFRASVERTHAALARYWHDQEPGSLEAHVATWRAVVDEPAFNQSPAPFRRDALNRYAIALNWRGIQEGRRSDLRAALDAWDRALKLADASWSNYAACLSNMARTMLGIFQLFGEADLDRAVDLSEEAVAAAPADDPRLAVRCLLSAAATHASRHHKRS